VRASFPAGAHPWRRACTRRRLVGRYPGWRKDPWRLPRAEGLQWRCAGAEAGWLRPLTVAGAAQVGRATVRSGNLCFPFNCAGVNTGTGTNGRDC